MLANKNKTLFRLTGIAISSGLALALAMVPVAARLLLPSTIQTKAFGPWRPLPEIEGAVELGRGIMGLKGAGKQNLSVSGKEVLVHFKGTNHLTGCRVATVQPPMGEDVWNIHVCNDFLKKPHAALNL